MNETSRRRDGRRTRRTLRSAAVAVVALPLVPIAAFPLALPAASAASAAATAPAVQTAGYGGGYGGGPSGGYGGYGAYGSPFAGSAGLSDTAADETEPATTTQSAGLVRIATVIDYGAGEAAGTGMVLTSTGLVVTNHHVVEGATRIRVTDVATGTTYRARLLGDDATTDVAVLRLVGASGLTTVTTDEDPVTVGDAVTAVGDANGDAGGLTASAGTVTALRRGITVSDDETGAAHRLRRLIEVDADVISGDSGGALYDADGEVAAMTVAASTGGADVSGYAIPIATVEKVVDTVLAGEETARVSLGYGAFLGVQLSQDSATVAGVLDGGAAARAGLSAGDTITAIDGRAVGSATALKRAVAAHDPGDRIAVGYRDASGTRHTTTATLRPGPIA